MPRWFAMVAAVAFLSLPALAGADETIIPPEAHWIATPSTPELVAVSQPRVVSSVPAQAFETKTPQPIRPFFALTEHDARYQAVNETAME